MWGILWGVNLFFGENMGKKLERFKTKYPGVHYIKGTRAGSEKPEKIFYIRYRVAGKLVEEKAGRQYQDDMTPAKAAGIRSERIDGKELSNQAKREAEQKKVDRWTITRLWAEYQQNKTRYKGLSREKGRYDNHIDPEFGSKEPHEISPLDVKRFQKRLLKDLSPQTVKNTLELLRRIVNFGYKNRLSKPFDFVLEMPKTDNIINESLNPSQIKSLLSVLDSHPREVEAWLLKVMLYTGRRTGEICGLEWDDLDNERQTFTLRDTKAGKTEQLPYSDRVKEIFKTMPRFHDVFIFPNSDGSRRTRIDAKARKLRDEAGIPSNYRPSYCLRHTFASVAASIDIPERALKALLGHADKAAKQDITGRYAHVSHVRLLKAANDIAAKIDRCRGNNVLNTKGAEHG